MNVRVEPRQDRSRRRRDALLTAAIELLAEGGARAVTHRAVAKRAGLPQASTTYYFESIAQLTEQALARHVANRVAELEELADSAASGGRTATEIARRFAEALTDRSNEMVIAQYEIYLEATRNPALRKPVADALAAFERLAASALELLGSRDPQAGAGLIVALIDGFALHRLARSRPREVEVEALFDALQALFIAQAMDADEFERWIQRFHEPLDAPDTSVFVDGNSELIG